MQSFGLKDVPVEKITDETLGLSPYVESLCEFVLNCETPMTIVFVFNDPDARRVSISKWRSLDSFSGIFRGGIIGLGGAGRRYGGLLYATVFLPGDQDVPAQKEA